MIGKVIKKLSEAVTALKGTKFYPNVAMQSDELSFAVYNISDRRPMTSKNAVTTIDVFVFSITIYSKDFSELDDVATITALGFDNYNGSISVSYNGGTRSITIHNCSLIDQSDQYDPDGQIHAREMNFEMILER